MQPQFYPHRQPNKHPQYGYPKKRKRRHRQKTGKMVDAKANEDDNVLKLKLKCELNAVDASEQIESAKETPLDRSANTSTPSCDKTNNVKNNQVPSKENIETDRSLTIGQLGKSSLLKIDIRLMDTIGKPLLTQQMKSPSYQLSYTTN